MYEDFDVLILVWIVNLVLVVLNFGGGDLGMVLYIFLLLLLVFGGFWVVFVFELIVILE